MKEFLFKLGALVEIRGGREIVYPREVVWPLRESQIKSGLCAQGRIESQ
jgi:hypothetical protein